MNTLFINQEISSVLHIAKAFAREHYNEQFGAPHVLRALLHPEAGLVSFIESTGKDPLYMREWAEVRMEAFAKVSGLPADPEADSAVEAILEEADAVRLRFGFDEISPLCLLTAILKPHTGFTPEQLKSLPLKEQDIYSLYNAAGTTAANMPLAESVPAKSGVTGSNYLSQYLSLIHI